MPNYWLVYSSTESIFPEFLIYSHTSNFIITAPVNGDFFLQMAPDYSLNTQPRINAHFANHSLAAAIFSTTELSFIEYPELLIPVISVDPLNPSLSNTL